MKYFREIAEKKVREEIARMVAQAGINNISLSNDKESYTGTYWISANNLYFILTGRHLNQDVEDGKIPANRFFDALNESDSLQDPQG